MWVLWLLLFLKLQMENRVENKLLEKFLTSFLITGEDFGFFQGLITAIILITVDYYFNLNVFVMMLIAIITMTILKLLSLIWYRSRTIPGYLKKYKAKIRTSDSENLN